jgi:hypothetical protein
VDGNSGGGNIPYGDIIGGIGNFIGGRGSGGGGGGGNRNDG